MSDKEKQNRCVLAVLDEYDLIDIINWSIDPRVKPMFRMVREGGEIPRDAKITGVQALSDHIMMRRLNNQLNGDNNNRDIMHKTVSCFRFWCKGEMLRRVSPAEEAFMSLHAQAIDRLDAGDWS